MAMYGILVGGNVILTSDGSGKVIQENPPLETPEGYKAKYQWVETESQIVQSWSLSPVEGTAEEAALALSKLQARSLPDEYAVMFTALYDEWFIGQSYSGPDESSGYAGDRIRYKGVLYKVLQSHVSQADWAPDVTPSLFAEILPGQSGNTPESGYAEWVRPGATNGYSAGDRVVHNGHLWESIVDSNVDEPGTDNGFRWKDLGEYTGD